MAVHYKGFRIYAIPRDGGYFARLRKHDLPFCRREAPFIETDVFLSEADALQEAKRMADGGDRREY
jgi:hypothetical protein